MNDNQIIKIIIILITAASSHYSFLLITINILIKIFLPRKKNLKLNGNFCRIKRQRKINHKLRKIFKYFLSLDTFFIINRIDSIL